MNERMGTLLAVMAALISGISIPANKVFIVVFLGISYFVREKKKKFIDVPLKQLALIAVVGGAIAFYLYFTGLKLTTASRAAFLHKTLPLYTAVLAFVFLKEKINRKYLAAMGLMLLGVFAIYFTTINPTAFFANPQLGDLLIIAATMMWAVENVAAKRAMKNASNWIVSFARMFFGGLILFGAVILLGRGGALLTLTAAQWTNIGVSTALLLGYVLFYYWALKLINVSKAAVLLLVAPVITLFIGITFLGEPAPWLQIAGSAAVLCGAYVAANLRSEERGI
jgi:drug/metabolite transporter (DMT)-like permease